MCQDLAEDLRDRCINGYVRGLVQADGPDSGKSHALAFCAQVGEEKERVSCAGAVSEELKKYSLPQG